MMHMMNDTSLTHPRCGCCNFAGQTSKINDLCCLMNRRNRQIEELCLPAIISVLALLWCESSYIMSYIPTWCIDRAVTSDKLNAIRTLIACHRVKSKSLLGPVSGQPIVL